MNHDVFSRKVFLSTLVACASLLGLAGILKIRKQPIDGSILGPDKNLGHKLRSSSQVTSSKTDSIKTKVLIAGGGISGLSVGYYLKKSGFDDFLILDLEKEAGGNSRYEERSGFKFPWGAHYLPQPGKEAVLVRKFLEDIGLVVGKDSDGDPIYSETSLCFDPDERLFYQGRWQAGLFPRRSGEPDEQEYKFKRLLAFWKNQTGRDGKKPFTIPIDLSSRDPVFLKLDTIPFATYLKSEGIHSPEILWYADYCVRDDYGGNSESISAWAGLHYFCSRPHDEGEFPSVLTWPEGNGFLMEKLRSKSKDHIRTSQLVQRIRKSSKKWETAVYDNLSQTVTNYISDQVVYALPSFTRKYILGERDPFLNELQYSPWLVANLFVEEVPEGKGHPPAWENVIYKSAGLGYVVSTHQDLRAQRPQSVLTYYQEFGGKDTVASRRLMFEKTWKDWKDQILLDLKKPHPNIESLVSKLDIMTYAHAMIRPIPKFLWSGIREKLATSHDGLHFAHSDLSGLSIFEEALFRGHEAFKKIKLQIGKES
ncbi:NAD(P)-binding Rossmann-like domain protein [Leptospira broomii serovar Hurstbridge str. 5399]|uniref:NAD(P)-binding Rossmann-like domain protein n=1 Tax=Leptospira broomii serovar Hurstbridge str. 5399 TaxID=1049789 RepID=T0F3X8_9LEPT|nr:NAD(P)-binding protein [Leptospira broomii]EQA45830.1 NAD(P)-binding Rossmann-like domain protein [Leptospira broomii serovar Hurstbridge str. 5399]